MTQETESKPKSSKWRALVLLVLLGVALGVFAQQGLGLRYYYRIFKASYLDSPPNPADWTVEAGGVEADYKVPARTKKDTQDWPQFHGEGRDGVSDESGIALKWPTDGPKRLWGAELGVGFGGAAIMKGEVFLLDRVDDEKDVLRCFDLNSGKELWNWGEEAPGRISYNGSRTVPAVTEKYVVATGCLGHVYAYDRAEKKLLWKLLLSESFGSSPPNFGFANSALILDDIVILAPMSKKAGLVAVEIATGKVRWSSPPIGGDGYASPALRKVCGQDQILFLANNNDNDLSAIDPKTGKLLWTYGGFACPIAIPEPVVVDENHIFLTGGYGAGSVMIEIEKSGDSYKINDVFRLRGQGAQIHAPIVIGDCLYANFNNNENSGNPVGLICLGLDGKIRWKTQRKPDIERGSVISIDGKLLVLGGQDGILRLVDPSPDGYKELASATMFKAKKRDNNMWAPMAFSQGKLVLRSQQELLCVDLKSAD